MRSQECCIYGMRERYKSEAIAGGVSTQFEDLIKNLKQTKAVQKKAKEKQQQEKNARLIGKIQKKKKKKKIGIENAKQKIGSLGLGKTRNTEDKNF